MYNRAVNRFAGLTALATFGLLGAGGMVTSHGVGMAVPDWPNTFGYNMFFFPFSQWVGGVFYEHTHRLFASGVGLLTSILAIWLYGRSARPFLRWTGGVLTLAGLATVLAVPRHWPDGLVVGLSGIAAFGASTVWPRCEAAPVWLRRLGLAAFFAVVLQGILGGLRVVLFKDQIGIFHATLAQLFFVLICSLVLFTSRWWAVRFGDSNDQTALTPPRCRGDNPGDSAARIPKVLGWFCMAATILILLQLILGATMRHQHAGLAIPDFPLAYGKFWPAMDAQSVAHYNQQRIEVIAAHPITGIQIALQMVHRLVAGLILAAVACCAWSAKRELGKRHVVAMTTFLWAGLIVVQALLGAATIWSDKAADIATAHVLVGALSLATGALVSIISLKELGFVFGAASVLVTRKPASPEAFSTHSPAPVGIK